MYIPLIKRLERPIPTGFTPKIPVKISVFCKTTNGDILGNEGTAIKSGGPMIIRLVSSWSPNVVTPHLARPVWCPLTPYGIKPSHEKCENERKKYVCLARAIWLSSDIRQQFHGVCFQVWEEVSAQDNFRISDLQLKNSEYLTSNSKMLKTI